MKYLILAGLFITSIFATDWVINGKYYLDGDFIFVSTISSKSPLVIQVEDEIYKFDGVNLIVPSSFSLVAYTTYYQPVISITSIVVISADVKLPKKIEVEEVEVLTKGLRTRGRGQFAQDVEISTSTRGLILTSPSDKKYLVWVDDSGTLFTTLISASPEVSFEERIRRMKEKKKRVDEKKKMIDRKSRNIDDLIKRIELIEEILHLSD